MATLYHSILTNRLPTTCTIHSRKKKYIGKYNLFPLAYIRPATSLRLVFLQACGFF